MNGPPPTQPSPSLQELVQQYGCNPRYEEVGRAAAGGGVIVRVSAREALLGESNQVRERSSGVWGMVGGGGWGVEGVVWGGGVCGRGRGGTRRWAMWEEVLCLRVSSQASGVDWGWGQATGERCELAGRWTGWGWARGLRGVDVMPSSTSWQGLRCKT